MNDAYPHKDALQIPIIPYQIEKYRFSVKKTGDYSVNAKLVTTSVEGLQAHRGNSIRIYGYTNRLMTQLYAFLTNSPVVYALFDPDGYLLKLFGNQESLAALKAKGIERGTIWSLDTICPNTVTVGLAERKVLYSVGSDNPCEQLKELAIYFSPVVVSDDSEAEPTVRLYGGLALIVPVEQHNEDYCQTILAATNDISLHLHVGDLYYKLYEKSADALLVFDVSVESGRISTLYHSKNIFDVFGVEPVDIYFRPADKLIDPLPENKDFWSIISEHQKVNDKDITLSVHGKKIACIVSTAPYNQPELNVHGITFLITTPQRVSAHISERMGNSAVRTFQNIIGNSSAIRVAIQRGKMLATSDSSVMLLGESGVGKDVFAQAIHNTGRRKGKSFIAVNCGALPRDLIASELFGYDSGAFTGAKKQGNIGKFELANGGTLFLDEIGELPLDLQATLLRAVEQKKITRLGGRREIDVDVRIISATNANIQAMIDQKLFRSDLYYRLNTLRLNIPGLRERGADIILLAEYFIQTISRRIERKDIMQLSADAKALLLSLPWKGNVRELQNVIEGIVQIYPESIITADHIMKNVDVPNDYWINKQIIPNNTFKEKQRQLLTEDEIRNALESCHGNRSEAARYLGIGRRTLYSNMERLGMMPPDKKKQ